MEDEKISTLLPRLLLSNRTTGCKEQHLKTSTYYRLKKIAFNSKQNTGSFIQLQPVSQSSSIEIVFVNGVKINFTNLIPVDYLKQLVS